MPENSLHASNCRTCRRIIRGPSEGPPACFCPWLSFKTLVPALCQEGSYTFQKSFNVSHQWLGVPKMPLSANLWFIWMRCRRARTPAPGLMMPGWEIADFYQSLLNSNYAPMAPSLLCSRFAAIPHNHIGRASSLLTNEHHALLE